MQQNFASNYWLGGYHTGGTIRGLNWLRGQWSGGSWQKGNFYSVDLSVNWSGANRNLWSIWSGGVWRSNSQNYSFTEYNILDEWSIWHGGTWKSAVLPKQTYSWQGAFTNSVNIYGDLVTYNCDIQSGNAQSIRTIYLPSPNSLWLGGQWFRGDFKGGIFACGVWHSLKWDPAQYAYLDDLFFLYGNNNSSNFATYQQTIDGVTYTFIVNDNENIPFDLNLFNDAEFFDIDLTVQYDESVSNFYQGAMVNSIWEGGTVINSSSDPFTSVFGMAIDTETSKIQDDSGFKSKIGFLESNQLLRKRRHGLNLIDYNQYYTNGITNSINQILFINGQNYYIPNRYDTGGIYSVIWKRGKFQNGAFMYGQWYDYNDTNTMRANYATDLMIGSTFDELQPNTTLPVNFSVFEQGLFYSSLWFNGIWLAKPNANVQNKTSVFSRSQWFTGYWAAAVNNATTFSNDRKITNSEFWKSIWYSGIWEGGDMSQSVWNCFNVFNYDLILENNVISGANNFSANPFDNIFANPMGVVNNITYQVNGVNTAQFNGFINDLAKVDLIRTQPVEGFDFTDLVINNLEFFVLGDGTSGTYDPGPYDFDLDETGTAGIPTLYLYNENEFFINDAATNAAFVRYAGLVDNFASRWKNGSARGTMWNGGIWMTGVFKSYLFTDYPTYVVDRRTGTTVQLDWFDDNIILQTPIQKIQPGVWQRGIWYAGYFHASSYFFGACAFNRNVGEGLNLTIENKFLFTDQSVSGQFNSLNATLLEYKPNNYVSIFTRKALRDADDSYFSSFNGQMLSGILYDVNKNGVQTPNFGTIASAEDASINGEVNFGFVTYDTTVNPDAIGNPNPVNPNTTNLSFPIKNTAGAPPAILNIAHPLAYDDINHDLRYALTTQQYINMFYYNSQQTVVFATGPDSNYNIRHAALTGNMPKWTDILPITQSSIRVPSTAQGSGEQELYYITLPPLWVNSGYGQ